MDNSDYENSSGEDNNYLLDIVMRKEVDSHMLDTNTKSEKNQYKVKLATDLKKSGNLTPGYSKK